ncbi:MAG: VWA domain-containing protein [Nannocystaceae bacterium]
MHEPRPSANLASLPALVDRTRSCFDAPRRDVPSWGPPPPRKRKGKRSSRRPSRPPGFVPYGGGGGGKTSSSGSSRTEDARSPGRSGGSGGSGAVGLGGLGRAQGGGASPKSESAPSRPRPEPTPAPVEEAEAPMADFDDGGPSNDSAPVIATGSDDDGYHDWGASIYLSNDDTMSLSSAQRVIYAIENFLPLPAEHIRPHELLNYFSFDTAAVGEMDDFSVEASIAPDPQQEGIYSLAMAVRGRPMAADERRNVNLSVVIDRSGSMAAEGRMEYLARGLQRMTEQLQRGDVIHLVLFDDTVCVPVENFVVGRDRPAVLRQAIAELKPRGSTNLHDGLRRGYELADRAYQPGYSNRVVMITDALTNRGVTDQALISTVGKFYDERRIRLSGVGVGRDFNDALLDRLTERGKGAYVFLGSEAEVDAVFGSRFVSLVETTALDVHFRLHLPPSLRMNVFSGEESSTVKEDVQAIHYFANTSQLFLSDLMARDGQLRGQDGVMLTIEYEDPETGDDMVEEYAFELAEITAASRNVRKGRLVMSFVDGLAWMASRPVPGVRGHGDGSWEDSDASEACDAGRQELASLAEGLGDDPEVVRVQGLWDRYCARYARPRRPVERPVPDTWPGASG